MSHTAATRYLTALAEHGVDSIFANAGTDFAPIVEAYAANTKEGGPELPKPVLCAHENLAGGMAHGAALVSGKPQAVMLHVNVGTANVACAVANAARDRIPLLITAGRSPILESGVTGARDLPIHWSQEMFDQASLVREFVKWDYELRDSRQVDAVVDRALSLATAHPRGPVYLALPREVLAEADESPAGERLRTPVPSAVYPDPDAIDQLADRIVAADFPVIVATASGIEPESVALLTSCAEQFAVGVADPWHRYLNIAANHPNRLGPDTLGVLKKADLIVFLESDVPWMDAHGSPRPDCFIAQVGVDPLYSDYPIRSHRADLNIAATPTAFLKQLTIALGKRAGSINPARAEKIRTAASVHHDSIAALRKQEAASDSDAPITKNTISAMLGELLGEDDIVFNEYVATPCLLNRTKAGTYYFLPASGGLGWGLPAALGAKYAAPDRTVIATLGDGAYMFANPAACHHAAAKHDLPILTILANNCNWWAVDMATQLVYPDGRANTEDRFSNLSPSPEFAAYCTASGGHGVTVHKRSELRAALAEALRVVREERRQALVDVRCV
ncbi:thiamine pyrophosphate-requiring protein [Sphingobium sp. EM0848]|uniref:thiamine pyrophosphate-requiring protein n=1 Tax=Sphingobium sp. EM0848 TaxID=2743473 RepID=UPI00159BF76C|nr:thiamine pyrophosphate-requiring protein [Sphingobium sp. EM0848]